MIRWYRLLLALPLCGLSEELPSPFPADPEQALERTCFQTSQPWSPNGNLRSDVAIVYGIGKDLPARIEGWRKRGYRIHVMTGVAWGNYQDYLYGRFDGENHVDNAQTDRRGHVISHGGDVYYMCPAENYGEFLSEGVTRALEAGVEAIHLEEPEFWARAGYSAGFKREWKSRYGEDWREPHGSVDAQWKCSKLKYFLYRRALQQIFDHVRDWNRAHGTKVRCYVPTHSLINYAHWCIVSPQSSLAMLDGCDGYIAQVWTGTARTPNHFRGVRKERTFETAFLEYGAMQNLVRATGRTVWYLNDPVEDNPRHDWEDYRRNWESTLVASLLQPEVWRYEVSPWPERVFGGRYPRGAKREDRKSIPPLYATELQVVMGVLNDMQQEKVAWDCGTQGVGVLVSDSLMFQREQPTPSDPNMAHFYGQALPLVKRGIPVEPVQLENVGLEGFLDGFRVLTLSYQGQKPLAPEVHSALADWVRKGGVLVVADDDSDPYNRVKEWWNGHGKSDVIPRQHLFAALGVRDEGFNGDAGPMVKVGQGGVRWIRKDPVRFALGATADDAWAGVVQQAVEAGGGTWNETGHFVLRRGPYVIAAGLDESPVGGTKKIQGRFINLFDAGLGALDEVVLEPGSRHLLLDLKVPCEPGVRVLAAACKTLPDVGSPGTWTVEGVAGTPAMVLIAAPKEPAAVTLDGKLLTDVDFAKEDGLLRIRFMNESCPRKLEVKF